MDFFGERIEILNNERVGRLKSPQEFPRGFPPKGFGAQPLIGGGDNTKRGFNKNPLC